MPRGQGQAITSPGSMWLLCPLSSGSWAWESIHPQPLWAETWDCGGLSGLMRMS